jgi:hypothetical protein
VKVVNDGRLAEAFPSLVSAFWHFKCSLSFTLIKKSHWYHVAATNSQPPKDANEVKFPKNEETPNPKLEKVNIVQLPTVSPAWTIAFQH